MIAGWIALDGAPALVVLEALDRPCRVDVLAFARDGWREMLRASWEPASGTLTARRFDAAYAVDDLLTTTCNALAGWRSNPGTWFATWTP